MLDTQYFKIEIEREDYEFWVLRIIRRKQITYQDFSRVFIQVNSPAEAYLEDVQGTRGGGTEF